MSPLRTVTDPAELLPFLLANWPEVKRTRVKQWLKFGSVRVNGKPITRHNHELRPGDKIEIKVERAPQKAAKPLPPGLEIIHEDDAIIVLNKAAGWLTVALDSGKGRTAYAALTDHVRATDPRNRVWIVHRLDRDTSGLIVFAKTEPFKRILQQNWHKFDKTYLAVVEGVIKRDSGTLRCHLNEEFSLRVRSVPPGDDTREAITHFKVLQRTADRTLVELKLETGRRHQLRVHLSDMGHPIVGDTPYGAKTDPAKRLALHATELKFVHPATDEKMTFTLPLPGVLMKLIHPSA
ncbi:RluA family pseudouridine synthase [Prosthecobacter sp.]|jgi:23S rRNA pseudouridine1911/1915/1917 synthase|uniref:RluA family pseudouridine synthase n=1 Tax=Prosthecobacter sp. TaxID=1965333 RepID=UPI003782D2BC